MKAVILCPGPSLVKLTNWATHRNDFDVVIAVKRAALLGCDWWVSGDWECFRGTNAIPDIGYCTTEEIGTLLKAGEVIPASANRYDRRSLCVPWERLAFHGGFSSVAALALAIYLGVEEVTVYGDDKTGDQDFDGVVGANRGVYRWEEELACRTSALEKMTAAGIRHRYVR